MNLREGSAPSPAELQAYCLGKLDARRVAEIESFLATHPECSAILEATPDDSVVRHLRGAGDLSTCATGLLGQDTVSPSASQRQPAADARGTTGDYGAAAAEQCSPEVPEALASHPRYHLLHKLGEGGMGAVFLAEHRLMHRPVALKVIRTTCLTNPAAVERFRREVRAAACLSHPNIVTAHDAEEAGGTHFLAMEYVEGVPLSDWLSARGPLLAAEACAYVRQAALGLQYAHEKGMVHRDLKPHNLMRTPDGTIKILDFGLARFACEPDHPDQGQLTAVGTVMGTADYIAPEQAQDSRTADIRADIYSLGCTLYQLLAGRVPFPEGAVLDKICKQLASQPQPLNQLRPDLPTGLIQVVEKMMAKSPAERYQTPGEVAAALVPFTPTVSAAGAGAARKRRRRPVLIATLVLLTGLLGGALLMQQIIIRIKNPDGSSTEIKAPVGAQVEIISPTKPSPFAPLDDAWLKRVAGLPADQQVQAVADVLKERNRDFDGKMTPTVEDGVVTEVEFLTHQVIDLTPLRALPRLRKLNCRGTEDKNGQLAGLSPLKDMKLTRLDCSYTNVFDLSPLKHMKLTQLECYFTNVSDLSPLKNMQLTDLNCWCTRVADLSPLQNMRLTTLCCRGTPVADLTPVKGMPLRSLDIAATGVADLSPVKGMPLNELYCGGTPISNLSPLKEMKLTLLECDETQVSDLSPLKGMPLTTLNITNTQVSDLSPLKDTKLMELHCQKTQISDLSPLKGLHLKVLSCDFKPERDRAILRSIKTLEKINDKPAQEFWKEVDAKKP